MSAITLPESLRMRQGNGIFGNCLSVRSPTIRRTLSFIVREWDLCQQSAYRLSHQFLSTLKMSLTTCDISMEVAGCRHAATPQQKLRSLAILPLLDVLHRNVAGHHERRQTHCTRVPESGSTQSLPLLQSSGSFLFYFLVSPNLTCAYC